jgi:hypothetical protein
MRRRTLLGIAALGGALVAGLAPQPSLALVDTQTITNVAASSASVSINAGLLDGTLPSADWTDSAVLVVSAWHGTVAATLFNFTGTWSTAAGSHNLTTATSGIYTGTLSQAYYTVTVTSDTGTSVSATVAGSESGTISGGAHGSALAVGTHGVTVRFDSGTTYANGDMFSIHAGNLPASAMKLHTATGTITRLSGGVTATFQNDGTTVSGNTPTVVGMAVQFITCPGGVGLSDSFHVVPGMEIVYDSNNVWAGPYVATVSYSILTGP